MPIRKTKSKATKKTAAKSSTGVVPPYGPPIRDAIARGNLEEMRAVARSARKWIKDAEAALQKLEESITKLSK
jgi:hypothetical protein